MTYDPDQLNRTEPSYLSAYGLTDAPFSSQHEDRFLYLSNSLNERLELLKHYTQYGNLLLLITGERGIGKSSLKQRFINTAPEEWQICEIQSHTMMDASLLLRQIAHGFNITEPPFDPSELFEVLSEQLNYMHQASYIPILIIDDAHELPQDALQALLYLAEHHSDQNTALRIILFCEPEIETMLEDPAIHSLKERVTHGMEIPPLDEMQTAEYLRHRLAVAGFDGTSPFTPQLIHKIFKASDGVPLKINDYAHQNLQSDIEPFISEDRELDKDYTQKITLLNLRNMIIGGLAATIVISVLIFQDNINSLFEEPLQVTVTETKEKVIPETIKRNIESFPEAQPEKEKTIVFDINTQPDKIPDEKLSENTKTTNVNNKNLPQIILDTVNPNPVPASKQRQIISISGKGFHNRQKVKVSWTGKEKILSDNQVNITSENYMNLILNTGTQPDTWTVTVIDTLLSIESNAISFVVAPTEKKLSSNKNEAAKQEKVEPKTGTLSKENGLYGENWIKQQNKDHFTLQLLGTHNKNTLPLYLKKFDLQNDAAVFETVRDNKDWFTLIYGHYSTKEAAQEAAKQLPKGVSRPWIRSFASITASLNKTSKIKTPSAPPLVSATTISENQEGWLWSQDPSHYTLQLTAGTDKKAIQAFIKRHKLEGKAVFFHRLRDGKDWYILVYGSYTGYSKAKQAISSLPSAVQKAKPWTRTFGAIHAELN